MTDLRAGYMKGGEAGPDPVADALTPAMTDPWSWSDDGEALVWGGPGGVPVASDREGETIVFREELCAMLAPLEREGLPDLAAVVLLAAGAREGGASGFPPVIANSLAAGAASGGLVARLAAGLERLAALPAALRQGARAKALLAEVVFEGRPRSTPPPLAHRVARALEGGLPLSVRSATDRRIGGLLVALAEALDQDMALQDEPGRAPAVGGVAPRRGRHPRLEEGLVGLGALADGLLTLDEAALRLRAQTGLDRLPRPAAPAPPGGGVRPGEAPDPLRGLALLDAVARLPELSGLARTARRILAATHLPRPLAEPLDLPVGGFADIASAGPLDRLLISELAHDAETLAVRIVEREALYVRREAPRKAPEGDRALLLDCGIRLWGAARVFAAATGLALAAHATKGVRVSAFRASGEEALPLSLESEDGLRALLAALDPAPHPAAALASFRRQAGLDARRTPQEAVLVTHEAALQDRALLEPLSALARERPRLRLLAATVDAEGRYRLSQIGPSGARRITEARIDLAELLETDEERRERLAAEASRAAGTRPQSQAGRGSPAGGIGGVELPGAPDARLPWALRQRPYPLLLPFAVEGLCGVMDAFGLVAAAPDGRLMHAPRHFRGGRALLDRRPPGRLLASHADEGRALLLFEHQGRASVVIADTALGSCRVTTLDPAAVSEARTPLAAWFEPAGVVLVDRRTIALFDTETGRRIRRFEAPVSLGVLEPLGRRFVLLGSAPRRVYVDAGAITLAPYPLMAFGVGPDERPLALLDRPGQDDPLLVTTRGVRTPEGERVPLVRQAQLSRGGESHEAPFTALLGASLLRDRILLAQRNLRGDRLRTTRLTLTGAATSSGHPDWPIQGVPVVRDGVPVVGLLRELTAPLFTALEVRASDHGCFRPGVLTRVERIGAAQAGRLAVFGGGRARSRRWWILDRLDESRIVLRPMDPDGVRRVAPISFERPSEPLAGAPRGCKVARFPDGSEAHLDPWGGLHLRSADRTVPETLLVLAFGPVAGVTAQGARMGPRWFHDEEAAGDLGAPDRWQEPVEGLGAARVVEAVTAFASRLG